MRRLGVDVGGTFTDLILYDEQGEQVHVHKLASTPADPAVAILQGVNEICAMAGTEPSQLSALLHGTTVGTNTILERRGAKVGMITTRGFRDILHIARHRKPYTFSLMQEIPQQVRPLILRQYRRCVPERMLVDGSVHVPLDEDAVEEELAYLAGEGIESVAVCFLSSFANAAHEERVREIVGTKKKKPRYNALVSLTTDDPATTQPLAEATLDRFTKRWKLDELVTNQGKPSELAYLVKLRKSMPGDTLMTEIRSVLGDKLLGCDLELSDALEEEVEEALSGQGA